MFDRNLNAGDLKKDLISYNFALLFNRRKAKKIRLKAAKKLYAFANGYSLIERRDCDLMDAYIKTFGYIKHRTVTNDAYNSFDRLNIIANDNKSFPLRRINASFYNLGSRLCRRLAIWHNRYDRVSYQPPATKTSYITAQFAALNEKKQQKLLKDPKKYRQWKLKMRQQAEKERAKAKKQNAVTEQPQLVKTQTDSRRTSYYGAAIVAAITAAALFGGEKFCKKAEKNNDDNRFAPTEKTITNTTESIHVQDITTSANDKQTAYKNYYDSALLIHLKQDGRTKLYNDLHQLIEAGKITVPDGESMEHLAHIMTVSRLIQPNAAITKLFDKMQNGTDLSGAEQNKIWHFVNQAGVMAQSIKGSGSHSNFDNQPSAVQQAHMQAVKAARRYN